MSDLASRLQSGIAAAALRSLPPDWPYPHGQFRLPALQPPLAELYSVRKTKGLTLGQVNGQLSSLAAELAASRPAMLAALFSSGALPARVPELAGHPASDPVSQWMGTCWVAEACWQALNGQLSDRTFAAGDRELLLPLAARLRFTALIEPMRHRAARGSPLIQADEPPDGVKGRDVTRVFGIGSWNELIGRCRAARQAWTGYLDAYQSHPFLARATSQEFEEELRSLVFRDRRRDGPIAISVTPLSESAPLTAEDATVIDEIAEKHLLPRFDLRSVTVLAAHDDTRSLRVCRIASSAAAALAWLAAAVCCAILQLHLAVVFAVAFYLLIGVGVLRFGPAWAAPWLLRLPAAAAVGVIALVSFLPGGWLQTPQLGWLAAVVLASAACGYLLVEARNHGVTRWALSRALAVTAIGTAHALMVSLVGLVAVAPTFVLNGKRLAALWHQPGYGHAGMVLLLATAWCLAVGVFSQILWDDRPITSPLAHMAWRSK
jgi:hypothetical protein